MNKISALLFFVLFSMPALSNANSILEKNPGNLVIITLDGVRWQEFFQGADPKLGFSSKNTAAFPLFWKKYAAQGVVFGNKLKGSLMQVAGLPTSLPSYQVMFTGQSSCFNNFVCMPGDSDYMRITEPSLFENIQKALHLYSKDVAVIASWDKIPLAVEQKVGGFFINAGAVPWDDQSCDPAIDEDNPENSRPENQPSWGSRYDRYTMKYALHYLQKYRPRLFYVSLNDTDEWGHLDNYSNYIEAMREQDRFIDQLFVTLKKMGKYGEQTTVLITTDHGRGNGSTQDSQWSNWTMHKPWLPESRDVWMYIRGPQIKPLGSISNHPSFTHSLIKPFVERAFGLPTEISETDRLILRLITD